MITFTQRFKPPGWTRSQWAGGWDVARARQAIEQHDMGRFSESWALATKVSQWSRIFGALRQRIAPTQRFPRIVEGGQRGLDRIVREEAEGIFRPGIEFPSVWSTIESLALMGFAWWQTFEVSMPDGTRSPRTEFWPTDATWYDVGRGRWYVWTQEEGGIEVLPDDPRWTLVAQVGHTEEPWKQGAVRAVGLEYVDAAFTRFDRSDYADNQGRPKPYAILPKGTQVSRTSKGEASSEPTEGDFVLESLGSLLESEAGAVFANGTELGQLPVSAEVAGLYKDILESDAEGVAIAILGTDGTVSKGTGGVYSSPVFQGVAENTVAADVVAYSSAATRVLERWRGRNYGDAKAPLKAVIQMPDTNRDARTASIATRTQAFHAAVKAEKENGFVLTQERVNDLARSFDISPPTLASTPRGAQSFAYDQENGVITINDRLEELGRPAAPGRGDMTVPAYRAWLSQQGSTNSAETNGNSQNTSAPSQ
jgi:hypothetical protein